MAQERCDANARCVGVSRAPERLSLLRERVLSELQREPRALKTPHLNPLPFTEGRGGSERAGVKSGSKAEVAIGGSFVCASW